jgi:hypothetical protein
VDNENAQGGMGEIPFTHAWPEVWVVEARDVPRARELILEFERPAPRGSPIRCPHCTESNPGNFQLCWNCGATL